MNVPLNIDWQQILLHLLNFVLLFAILYFLLYAPVKKFMEKRCEYYKNINDDAKDKLHQAEELKNEYAEKLRLADNEIEEKMQAASKSISEKNAQGLALAKQEADKIIADAHEKAEQTRKKMIESAQEEITTMAVKAAEKIVANTSTSDAFDSFLSSAQRSEADE